LTEQIPPSTLDIIHRLELALIDELLHLILGKRPVLLSALLLRAAIFVPALS